MTDEPVALLADPALDDGAEPTFRRLVELLRGAERSVEVRMFVPSLADSMRKTSMKLRRNHFVLP